jgi:hypothetical protein
MDLAPENSGGAEGFRSVGETSLQLTSKALRGSSSPKTSRELEATATKSAPGPTTRKLLGRVPTTSSISNCRIPNMSGAKHWCVVEAPCLAYPSHTYHHR